jgi:hypothetical protein
MMSPVRVSIRRPTARGPAGVVERRRAPAAQAAIPAAAYRDARARGHALARIEVMPAQRSAAPRAEDLRPKGAARPLPEAVRSTYERAYGADLSAVRLHVNQQPRAIGAQAYTLGDAVAVDPAAYRPHSSEGTRLLGHELAHVLQQRAGRVPVPAHGAVQDDPALEAEADHMAAAASRVGAVPPAGAQADSPGAAGAMPQDTTSPPAQAAGLHPSDLDEENDLDELLGDNDEEDFT